MKNIRIWLILAVLLFTGCASKNNDSLSIKHLDVNKEEIYYNPIEKKLLKFNPNGNKKEIINAGENSIAYDIYGAGSMFVIGDSKLHQYKLVDIEKTEIKTIFDFDSGQEIIPIGLMDGNLYFINKFYENDQENRDKTTISVLSLSDFTITQIENIHGDIKDGIVSPKNIFYTTYKASENYYELYKKSIESGKKGDSPELISVGYETADLYLSKDLDREKEIISLYASDEDRIYSQKESWDKHEANYFTPSTVIGIDKDGEDMTLSFMDKRTRTVFTKVDNAYGIRFEGDTIVVATDKGASKY